MRLPKAFQFETCEVIIKHFANGVLLMPKKNTWKSLQKPVNVFESDFRIGTRTTRRTSARRIFMTISVMLDTNFV